MRSFALAIAFCVALGSSSAIQAAQSAGSPMPKWVEAEIDREPPLEALAIGEHGTVVIEGDVSDDHHVINSVVTTSSRSRLLDEIALKTFGHARLSDEMMEDAPSKVRLKIEFGSYDFDNMGVGYQCKQAILDSDWYAANFPDRPIETSKFKTFLQAAGMTDNRMAFAQNRDRFEAAWRETLSMCRDRPSASVMGLIVLVGNGKTSPK